MASRLKASRTQQAEGVDAARTQPAGRGTDQKRARACTKESPYVFEPEMPRWIAQELREKRQANASASRGAAAVQVRAQVTQERPCRSCAAETAGLPLAGIDGEAVCLNPQPLRLLSLPRACVRPSLPPFRVRHPAPLTRLPGTHSSPCMPMVQGWHVLFCRQPLRSQSSAPAPAPACSGPAASLSPFALTTSVQEHGPAALARGKSRGRNKSKRELSQRRS